MQKIALESAHSNSQLRGARMLPGPTDAVRKGTASNLTPALVYILSEVQRDLGLESLNASETAGLPELEMAVRKAAAKLGFELSAYERDEVLARIEAERRPFGILQPLIEDERISDIIVTSHSSVSVQLGRRNFSTELSFPSLDAYQNFVERLLQKAGTTYSNKKPIADGMIGGLARVHAVHKSICDTGPYLTIRINRFSRVSIEDLVQTGMAPKELFAYLAALIRCGKTLLIAGEVGTGKTTLARALAASISHEEDILVIEDTPEIMLEHPHVRYLRTREANSDGAGRVAPAECIRAGMRMAMNRVVFGEMRDAEAAEAFIDVCASGHPGLSTVHARSAGEAVSRLELFLGRAQKGASKSVFTEQIAAAVQAIIYVDVCAETGRRRVIEVREIGPLADGALRQREMFRYQCTGGVPTWRVSGRVSAHRGQIEGCKNPVFLACLPSELELSTELLMKEIPEIESLQSKRAA